MIVSVNLLIQLTSTALWGEILHTSGFFAHVLRTLNKDKASCLLQTAFAIVIQYTLGAELGSGRIPPRAGANCYGRPPGLSAAYVSSRRLSEYIPGECSTFSI
jgi:hypothetical protein